jgi:capsular exopolysaccharide synthesis family protein
MIVMENETVQVDLPPPPTAGPPAPGLMDLWRRYRLELSVVVIFALGGVLFLCLAWPKYRSSASLYVQLEGSQMLSGTPDAAANSNNYVNTQCELLRSSEILGRALDQPGIRALSFFTGKKDPLSYLQKKLDIQTSPKHSVITLSLAAPKPTEPALIINAILDSYTTYRATHQRSTTTEVLKIFEKEKARREEELAAAHKEMVDFKQTHALVALESEKDNIIFQRMARLSESLGQAQVEAIRAKAAHHAAQTLIATEAGVHRLATEHSQTEPARTPLEEQLAQLQLQLASLQRQCTSEHPSVRNLQAQITQVQGMIQNQASERDQAAAQGILAGLLQDCELADKVEQELRASLDQQQKLAESCGVQTSQLAIIQSKILHADRLCEILDSRMKELNLSENAGSIDIAVLGHAGPAVTAEYSSAAEIVGGSSMVGMLFALGLNFLRSRMNGRLRSVAEMMERLSLPILAAVPEHCFSSSRTDSENELSLPSGELRRLGVSLAFMMGSRQAKVLVVTSAESGAGKTTIAADLSRTFALRGGRTVLVDATTSGPSVGERWKLALGPGLAGVLAGQVTLRQALGKGPAANLDVLVRGPGPLPSGKLSSREFAATLEALAQIYAHVVVDCSAALKDPDVQIACAAGDAVILAVRKSRTRRVSAERTANTLANVGARVIGVVATHCANNEECPGYRDWSLLSWPRSLKPSAETLEVKAG